MDAELQELLSLVQAVVGTRTSDEITYSSSTMVVFPPKSAGDLFREQAEAADRKDRLIVLAREMLERHRKPVTTLLG